MHNDDLVNEEDVIGAVGDEGMPTPEMSGKAGTVVDATAAVGAAVAAVAAAAPGVGDPKIAAGLDVGNVGEERVSNACGEIPWVNPPVMNGSAGLCAIPAVGVVPGVGIGGRGIPATVAA